MHELQLSGQGLEGGTREDEVALVGIEADEFAAFPHSSQELAGVSAESECDIEAALSWLRIQEVDGLAEEDGGVGEWGDDGAILPWLLRSSVVKMSDLSTSRISQARIAHD
jgi:hypothetical protein